MTIKKTLQDNPEILKDIKKMMALLVEKLPKSELNRIDLYYRCVEYGIVSEMLGMEFYSKLDIDYYADKFASNTDCSMSEIKTIIENWLKMLSIGGYDYYTGIRYRLLNSKIKDLDFDNAFKKTAELKGYTTFEDLLQLTIKELIVFQRDKEYDATDVVSKISEIIRVDKEKYGGIYSEDNHPGKSACNTARKIRKKIAEANNIPFEPIECHNSEPCLGICDACDKEIEYLNKQIEMKIKRGEIINLEGVAKNEIEDAGFDMDSFNECICEGMSHLSFDMFPYENRPIKGEG